MGALEDDIDATLRSQRADNEASHAIKEGTCSACGSNGIALFMKPCVSSPPLTFDFLFRTNIERCKRWHPGGIEEWSALEWAGAMTGKAGEAANAAKKLKRVESKLQNINAPGRQLIEVAQAQIAIAAECADTILYALLLMARIGVDDPERTLRTIFNRKSIEYGFPERI